MAQTVKSLLAMQVIHVQSLDWEDSLEKGMATHSSILTGEFYGQRSLADYSPWGRKESDTTEQLSLSLFFLEWKIMAVCCHFINFLWKHFYLLNKLRQGQLANPFSYQNFTDLRKQCSVSPSVL